MGTEHVKAPKQRRSRQSYDRMVDSAIEIMGEGGLSALTLAEVSRRSRVSIGSIYCRVDSKEALLREVQSIVLNDMDREFAMLVNRVRRKTLPLRELVPTIVRELALYLRRHARHLSAFMEQGARDPLVEAVGRKSYQQNELDFKLILLERHSEFRHGDPERAAATCFWVVYSALARFLGLGATAAANDWPEGDWKQLIEELGVMALAYLATDPEVLLRAPAKAAR